MRWVWIDRILELEKGQHCKTVKNISLAEEVLHDHFQGFEGQKSIPVLPNSLVIEGMAQTAGILVGHANAFKEKVALAKIGKAEFDGCAGPGHTLVYEATLERIDGMGASTSGVVKLIDSATGESRDFAKIDLMFSHLDNNMSGLSFPEHNFVFSGQIMNLLEQSGFDKN